MGIKQRLRVALENVSGYKIIRRLPHGISQTADVKRSLPGKQMEVIFDIGAHIGQSAASFSKHWPGAIVYCFEPSADTFATLKKATAGLRCHCYNVAVGATPGSVEFSIDPGDSMNSMNSIINRDVVSTGDRIRTESVEMISVDSFCKANGIHHIDFLKIDTEGFDLEVLKGAGELLQREAIDFVEAEVSMNPLNTFHVSSDQVKKFMEDRKYILFGVYEQTQEWKPELPILRRANMVFISHALALSAKW